MKLKKLVGILIVLGALPPGAASGAEDGTAAEARAIQGKIKEVSYVWPKPGGTEPVEKVSYVTKVGDQVCGVGYYRQQQS